MPDVPSAVSPLNDEWVYTDEYTLTPDVRPTLEWATSGTVPVSGWSVEMDQRLHLTRFPVSNILRGMMQDLMLQATHLLHNQTYLQVRHGIGE